MALQRLVMKNFRRHADTTIAFDDVAQLTLIAGKNGSGKSTILEAIKFAYYGEGRSTKTKLDSLVRRGAELEGLTVTLDFTFGVNDYTVERRYDSGNSYAQLRLDGQVIAQGSREVTREISRMFGMDSQGFSLAAFASQKQLNALTSMSRARRAQTVSRLMRADVFTKARDEARSELLTAKRVIRALGQAPDTGIIQEELDAKTAVLDGVVAARDTSADAVRDLVASIEARADVQARFQEASAQHAQAQGAHRVAKESLAAAQSTLDKLQSQAGPRPEPPAVDVAELEDSLAKVLTRLEAAKEAARARQDHKLLTAEVDRLNGQLATAEHKLAELQEAETPGPLTVELGLAEEALRSAAADVLSRSSELAGLRSELAAAKHSLDNSDSLQAVCDSCGQQISPAHKKSQHTKYQALVDKLTARVQEITQKLTSAREAEDQASASKADLVKRLSDAQMTEVRVTGLEHEISDLRQRSEVASKRIAALQVEGEPVADVADERTSLELQVQQARTAERAVIAWDRASNELASAELAVSRAERLVESTGKDLAAAQIPADLLDAVEELTSLGNALASERELLNDLELEVARAEQHMSTSKSRLESAQDETARRQKLIGEAESAEAASRLLTATAGQVTGRIRPALEGATSAILSTMSEGRFDSVRISQDYSVMVRDDGDTHPLEELSGGEQDLVGLALRLGMAAVVAARHGSPGPGFLVLDEVFGSQDAGRRESILTGLRALRVSYPQILLVSHVDGAEDAVDTVLNVERVEDDDSTVADAVVTLG